MSALSTASPTVEINVNPSSNFHFITSFDVLYLVSLLALLSILITAHASSRVRRLSTWHAFLGAWIFECLSKLSLVGQQTSPVPPQFGICAIQASLIEAAPVLYVFMPILNPSSPIFHRFRCAFYTVTFVLHVCDLQICCACSQQSTPLIVLLLLVDLSYHHGNSQIEDNCI